MRLPCRDASKRPGFDELAPQMRGWRAERRKPMVSCLAARGRLSARQSQRLRNTGPRFPLPAMAGRSASSWQGLLMVPGGAPMPPECLVATRPAGAAPRPASRRLMMRPQWTRWVQDRRGLARGDKAGIEFFIPPPCGEVRRRAFLAALPLHCLSAIARRRGGGTVSPHPARSK